MFFHFYKKTVKTCKKNIKLQLVSIQVRTKKHRQYESNKVNNTATKHSLCPGNGVSNSNKATRPECTECYYVTVIMVQIENRANRNLPKRNASYL